MTTLAVQLDVVGRRCVVVGAGPVGARRASALVDAGADVLVVGPRAVARVRDAAASGAMTWQQRDFVADDLAGAVLAVAATGVAAVDDSVSAAGRHHAVLVNRADRAGLGDLSFPAVLRRGPLSVAVSTGAAAPAVTRLLAEVLDDGLDAALGLDAAQIAGLVEVVAEVRSELRDQRDGDGSPAPLDWRSALDGSILDLIRQGRRAETKERLLACLSSS